MKLPKVLSSSASLSLLPNSADLRVLSCFSCVHSLQPHGLYPARILSSWNFPDKNTGVGRHALLQGIFLTQGWNPHLLVSCIGRRVFTTSATWEVQSP